MPGQSTRRGIPHVGFTWPRRKLFTRYNVTLRYTGSTQSIYGPTQSRLEEALHRGLELDGHSNALEGMEIYVEPHESFWLQLVSLPFILVMGLTIVCAILGVIGLGIYLIVLAIQALL
jgi:hypothetical protein